MPSLLRIVPIVLLLCATAHGARDLAGTVRDARTLLPVPYAQIELTRSGMQTEADAQGRFVFTALPNGEYRLCVRRIGYATLCDLRVTVGAEEWIAPTVLLEPEPLWREPHVVVAGAAGAREPAPSIHRVITAEDIDHSGARNAADVLVRVPEVEVLRSGGAGAHASIRGSRPEAVRVLVDGVAVGTDGRAVDLASIPAGEIDRIEVMSGPAAASSGADALGGAIFITTRAPAPAPIVQIGGAYGSYGQRDTDLEVDGLALGRQRLRMAWHNALTDGDFGYFDDELEADAVRANNHAHRQQFSARGDGTLGRAIQWQGSIAHYRVRAGVPGPEYQLTPQAWRRQKRVIAALAAERRGLTGGFAYTRDWNYFLNAATLPYESETTTESSGGYLGYRWTTSTLRGAAVRAEYQLERNSGKDHLNPVFSFGTARRSNYAVVARYGRRLSPAVSFIDRAEIDLAYRYDRTETDAEYPVSIISPVVDPPEPVWTAGSPQATVAVHGGRHAVDWSVQAGYGKAYRRPPLFDQFWDESYRTRGNPGLRPERSEQVEWGYALQLNDPVVLGFRQRYYRSRYTDLIVWRIGQGGVWTPGNIGRARIDGREEFVHVAVAGGALGLDLAHLFLNHRNTAGEPNTDGEPLPFRYRHKVTAAISTRWRRGWVEVSYRWYDRRYLREVGPASKSLDPYAVTDITSGIRGQLAGLSCELRLTLANVADEPYELLEREPMPGRSLLLSLHLQTGSL